MNNNNYRESNEDGCSNYPCEQPLFLCTPPSSLRRQKLIEKITVVLIHFEVNQTVLFRKY